LVARQLAAFAVDVLLLFAVLAPAGALVQRLLGRAVTLATDGCRSLDDVAARTEVRRAREPA
jgi:hypothetical protein